jgi:hypothetical protein
MLIDTLKHALMITSFVMIMMLLIEYLNIMTRGVLQRGFARGGAAQYLLAALLGATPGCLGAFAAVSLYGHGTISFGALVATMIATSGDEAFVMLSMFPGVALAMSGGLFAFGALAGWLTDRLLPSMTMRLRTVDHEFRVHDQPQCRCLPPWREVAAQLRSLSFVRFLLLLLFGAFLFVLVTGVVGPAAWNWKRVTFAALLLGSLFIVATVPEHFLEEHLWKHVIQKHLLRIFLWTAGALLAIHLLEQQFDVSTWVQDNQILVLLLAVIVGIIPESGPHLVFVTLYAQGTIPISILIASSIVQDGHGTLPLLATSGRSFMWLKLVNIAFGLAAGLAGLAAGL